MQKKTGSMMGGRLLQHAIGMEVCVLSPMHLSAEACRVRGLTAFKIGFPADHVYQHQWQHYTETWWCKNRMAQFAIYWGALWRLQEMWHCCQGLQIPHID